MSHPSIHRVLSALAGSIGVALLATGCVTQGTYEEVVAERDALRDRLDATRSDKQELEGELAAVSAARDDLSLKLDAVETEVAELRGTYDALVGELEGEIASGQVKIRQLRDGVQLNLSQDVLFPSGSAELDPQGRELLARVASQVGDGSVIAVEGHTDSLPIGGTLKRQFATNWELAAARAAGVVRLLNESGIEGERLRAVSRGPFAPVAENDTPEGRRQNRRIEILLRPPGAR